MPTTGYQAGVESNDVELSYGVEATWGVVPAVAFKAIRFLSENFSGSKSRQRPNEVRTDGQASAAITMQESATAGVNFALSYGTYDDLLGGLLNGDWTTALAIDGVGGDISTVATGNKLTSTTAGKFANIAVGQWIRLFGFTAANNGFYRVSAKTSNQDITLAGKTVTNETPAGTNAKVRGSMLRNGTSFTSFFFQKKLASALFLTYPGTYFANGSLTAGLGQFMQGSFGGAAKEEAKAVATSSTGSVVAAPTGRVHDTVAGLQALQLNGTAIDAVVESISVEISKEGAQAQYGVSSASAQGMIRGNITVSGRLRVYFKNFTLYDLFKAETAGHISFRTLDDTGAGYVVSLPAATIMNPQVLATGPNQSVMAEFTLEGNPDATTGCTIQIDRFAAAAA